MLLAGVIGHAISDTDSSNTTCLNKQSMATRSITYMLVRVELTKLKVQVKACGFHTILHYTHHTTLAACVLQCV